MNVDLVNVDLWVISKLACMVLDLKMQNKDHDDVSSELGISRSEVKRICEKLKERFDD